VGLICKSEHGRGPCKRLSKRGSRRFNDLTRIVTSFSDSPRDFANFVSRVQGIGVTRLTRFFHHLHLFRQSHGPPLRFFH